MAANVLELETISALRGLGDTHMFDYDGVEFTVDFTVDPHDVIVSRVVASEDFHEARHTGAYELLENAESGDITAYVEPHDDCTLVGFAVPKNSTLSVRGILTWETRGLINRTVDYVTGTPGYHYGD